jgi:NitT/TauT family transport system substrate-binding protein
MVPPESPIVKPDQLADVEVYVGYYSGSHYPTIESLEEYLPSDRIRLRFGGLPDERVDAMIAREAKAADVFGTQCYILEGLDFRVITDTTFMTAGMVAKASL